MATINKGDEVIIPAPYWVSYPDIVSLCGGKPVIVDTKIENDFKITSDELEKHITKNTKWFIINSPGNPTGAVYTKDNLQKISDVLLSNNIKAVILSNTSDSTRDKLNDIQKHQKGGLSGKPIEEKSTMLINKFYKTLGNKIKIIGVGGVDSGISAYNKFLAGASYVQLYTGMVYRGPNIVNLIKKELKELLIRDGVKHYSEIIGKKTTS